MKKMKGYLKKIKLKKSALMLAAILIAIVTLTKIPYITQSIIGLKNYGAPGDGNGVLEFRNQTNAARSELFAYELVFFNDWENIKLDGFKITDETNLKKYYQNYNIEIVDSAMTFDDREYEQAIVIRFNLVKNDTVTFPSIPDGTYYEVLAYAVHGVYDLMITGHGTFSVGITGEFAYGTMTAGNNANINFHFTGNSNAIPDARTLSLEKYLDGYYEEWGIADSTVYRVKILDVATNRYLNFDSENFYTGLGYTGSYVEISPGQTIELYGLPVGRTYRVEEEFGRFYERSYSKNNIVLDTHDTSTITNTYVEPPGDFDNVLILSKELTGFASDWGVTSWTEFSVRLKDVTTGEYLMFNAQNEYVGTSSTGTEVFIKSSANTVLIDLPAGMIVSAEEAFGFNYTTEYSTDSVTMTSGTSRTITITNNFDHGFANLVIDKILSGSYAEWGVTPDTYFYIRVKDLTDGSYLYFYPEEDGTYYADGNNGSSTPTSDARELVPISASNPTVLTNLWAGHHYRIEEVEGENYTTYYDNVNILLSEGANDIVSVINTFDHGTGELTITKSLAGSYTDWGVNRATVFQARVKDVNANNYVHFELQPNGKYLALGNSGLSYPTSDPREIVEFSVGTPAVIYDLWSDIEYLIEEIEGDHYEATYEYETTWFPSGGNMNVDVINTYEHGTGILSINKNLSGFYTNWGIDNNTIFKARVKDVTDGNYIYFYLQEDGTYYADGNNNSSVPTGDTREIVEFTARNGAILTNLWANQVYLVEEIGNENYHTTYFGNNVSFPEGGNMSVTVNNFWDHAVGNLIIIKELAGAFYDWGVDNYTTFDAEVWDRTDGTRLRFIETASGYRCVGNDGAGLSEVLPPGVTWTNTIKISKGRPTDISNLWSGDEYEVVEKLPSGDLYTASYSPNVVLENDENAFITITNTYKHGTGNLIISKIVTGRIDEHRVDETTVFSAKIFDVTDGAYLLFKDHKESDGSYRCIGNSIGGLSEPYFGSISQFIDFDAKDGAVISNLWSNNIYVVEEVQGINYEESYFGNERSFPTNGNMNVTITNLFKEGPPLPHDPGEDEEDDEHDDYIDPPCACDFSYFIPSTTRISAMSDGSYKLTAVDGEVRYLIPKDNQGGVYQITNSEKVVLGVWICDSATLIWTYNEENPDTGIMSINVYCMIAILSALGYVLISKEERKILA